MLKYIFFISTSIGLLQCSWFFGIDEVNVELTFTYKEPNKNKAENIAIFTPCNDPNYHYKDVLNFGESLSLNAKLCYDRNQRSSADFLNIRWAGNACEFEKRDFMSYFENEKHRVEIIKENIIWGGSADKPQCTIFVDGVDKTMR